MTKIAVPIKFNSIKELKERVEEAEESDILELWVDKISTEVTAKEIIKACGGKPLIITCKAGMEKGEWQGTEEARVSRLAEFIKAGVKYIDIGIDTDRYMIWDLGKLNRKLKSPTKIIISYHDFKGPVSEKYLWIAIDRARFLKADIVKVAVKAKTLDDNLVLFKVQRKAEKENIKLIALCMGEKGKISRIASPLFGSPIVYAGLSRGRITAPGQLLLEEYKQLANLIKL